MQHGIQEIRDSEPQYLIKEFPQCH